MRRGDETGGELETRPEREPVAPGSAGSGNANTNADGAASTSTTGDAAASGGTTASTTTSSTTTTSGGNGAWRSPFSFATPGANEGGKRCWVVSPCEPCSAEEASNAWCKATGRRQKVECRAGAASGSGAGSGTGTDQPTVTQFDSCTADSAEMLRFLGACVLVALVSAWYVQRRKRLAHERLVALATGRMS